MNGEWPNGVPSTQILLDFSQPALPHPGLFHDIKPEIVEAFITHHKENPGIYDLFKRFAEQARASGAQHFGAKAIMERIRWEWQMERRGDFKINNNFASCYARLLQFDDKSFADFFETRHTPGTVEGVH